MDSGAPLSDLPMSAERVATMPRTSAVAGRPPRIVVMAILFEGGLGLLGLIAGPFMATPPWRLLRGNPVDFVYGLAATLPMLAALWAMRTARTGPLGRLNSLVDQLVAPLFSKCTVLQLALISLVAGVGEELLFRGAIQPVLIGWMDAKGAGVGFPVIGVAAASAIFGL